MPATEQTWRDSKLLHVIFGVSSLLMLLATIWMLAKDHDREWKRFQREFRDVETWTAQSRVAQQDNAQYHKDLADREAALHDALCKDLAEDKVNEFRARVEENFVARQKADPTIRDETEDFRNFDKLHREMREAAPEEKPRFRERLVREMNRYITDARFRENIATTKKKYRSADFDVARSKFEIAVGENASAEELKSLQDTVDEVRKDLEEQAQKAQDTNTYRKGLERIVADITADENQRRKEVDAQKAKLETLQKAVVEREDNFGKELLSMPIIDAFGRPLDVKQIWLPKLTINYNFRDVARFDRCTTCHLGIETTAPGSAINPGYEKTHFVALELQTPAEAPAEPDEKDADPQATKLEQLYGMKLAKSGLLDRDDVSVSVVVPEGPAAKAQMMPGDVITKVDGAKVLDRKLAYNYLVDRVNWGKPIALEVRRGVPNPYTSHPRLDLFVGSLSPHKLQEVGCTICHEGQGSATEFKWASHSPNDPSQGAEWRHKYDWFHNHHWIFPMNPKRFAEKTCLKCHHEVTDLEPSERFPDPPAPKLMEGYTTIRHYGCFGCHEINGFDGPNRRVGPDMRSEPNYSAAAQALLVVKGLSDEQRDWAQTLAMHPENEATRHELLESIRVATNPPKAEKEESPEAPKAEAKKVELSTADAAAMKKLGTILEDVESPGKLRKVGPSLRHVDKKLDYTFLYSWIRRPKDFRPSTRMPQFFGLWEHLDGKGLEESKKFEPVEIRGITAYLLAKSQPFEYAKRPEGVTEEPSGERGKKLFETRGCLACHQHRDFPKAKMNQGPDLSRIGAKLDSDGNRVGAKWLYSWLRNPSAYHPRTLMPNLLLDPLPGEKAKVTDPAADLTVFLLGSRGEPDWKATDIPAASAEGTDQAALKELALMSLKEKFPRKQAEQYLEHGIPESRQAEIKGDEVEMLGETSNEQELFQKQLNYVGRRAISKYGCSGCHDIPGYEDVKPIGTGLADWGRKAPDKLAFEQIAEYLTAGHGHKQHAAENEAAEDKPESKEAGAEAGDAASENGGEPGSGMLPTPPVSAQAAATHEYFMEALLGHQREGFIWQKLRALRSYDYEKTQNKGYNERLRMPKFNIDDEQREAVITFVLGLVAEPPAPQYVYKPTPQRHAIIEGMKVVDKFNCTGCHTLQMDRWKLAYAPDQFPTPAPVKDYPFLEPHATPKQIKDSLNTDIRGLRHATISGMPVLNEVTGAPVRLDEDNAPIEDDDTTSKVTYRFVLWDNAVVNGQIWGEGIQNLLVPESTVEKRYPPVGGYLARLIYPTVFADEKQINPNAKAEEAWGWLPPPLVNEGRKVQTNWLYDFLLDPHPIRPAVVLRMPKFNMSPAEASALVNYFAAVDGADYPYDFDPRTRESHLAAAEEAHPHLLKDALKIVTDNNYCIKCHLVGDFQPAGSDRAKAPHLDQVYKRLRPGFVRPWIANPKRLLPYTGMPVNVPYDKPVSQELFHGDSTQQLDGLVDLLMNYDRYTESQFSIKPMIKAAPKADAAEKAKNDAGPAKDDQAAN